MNFGRQFFQCQPVVDDHVIGHRQPLCPAGLLVESGRWRAQVDRILVVDCAVETQITRVMQRNGWTADAVQRIIDQQASRAQRLAVADDVIVNDGLELEELATEVQRIWSGWL